MRLRDRLRIEKLIVSAINTGIVPDFCSSVEAFYDANGFITPKQEQALENILDHKKTCDIITENVGYLD